jgi:membrane associated rhomboid family serine protease
VIPLSDSPLALRTPWVNLSLIAVNVLVFLYELSLGQRVDPFLSEWGVVPAQVRAALAGSPRAEPAILLTLVTAMFLHAGWLHLGGNMLFLWIFGDNVEDRLGHATYLAFYLTAGIVANLVQVFADPTSPTPGIGASGAIAGVLGAYALTFPGARVSVVLPLLVLFWVIEVPALILIGIWFATQFFGGVASLSRAGVAAQDIAWWAHVGGFTFGVLAMAVLPKQPLPLVPSRTANREQRAREDTGLLGLAIGTISMASQVIQLAIGFRVVGTFLSLETLPGLRRGFAELIRLTNPFILPFAPLIPHIRLAGRSLEVDAIVAIAVYYLLGLALVWAIAALTDRPSPGAV